MSLRTNPSTRVLTYPARLEERATETPDALACVFVDERGTHREVTVGELNALVLTFANGLKRAGVDRESLVLVALPTSPEHIATTLAAWRLGACVCAPSPNLPVHERASIIGVAESWRDTFVIEDSHAPDLRVITTEQLHETSSVRTLPDILPAPGKAICSGGSTGTPKIIVDPKPWQKAIDDYGSMSITGVGADEVQLVMGRLYHNTSFMSTHRGLFDGHTLILMERFDAALAADLIERHRVTYLASVPVMLQRIARLPDVSERDFSSVRAMFMTGAAAPAWMRDVWSKLVPPERQFDIYGAAEGIGQTVLRGDEWTERPGSVGRPHRTDVVILDDEQRPLPAGEVGTIYMRPQGREQAPFFYVGDSTANVTEDGFYSVGDVGYLDDAGYLFLLDRRQDMIVSGGANVYCSEVEQAITSHPDVLDAVVIGLPDSEWGQRVHAIIERTPSATVTATQLDHHLRQLLSTYKLPKTYEWVERLPRDESGKIRRSGLRDERLRNTRLVRSTQTPSRRREGVAADEP